MTNETILLWGRTSLSKTSKKNSENEGPLHALIDHDYGIFNEHVHVPGHHYDHDHDDDFDEGPLEDNPLWQQDNIFLSTVGIDIGSSSTQVVFSQVHLERQGEARKAAPLSVANIFYALRGIHGDRRSVAWGAH
ncbi:MAG: hypothetical protein EBW06_04820 [Gammaproteobacteria bacterium]|nr:hypothetical protein [Gammaproteobacteria bacterium]